MLAKAAKVAKASESSSVASYFGGKDTAVAVPVKECSVGRGDVRKMQEMVRDLDPNMATHALLALRSERGQPPLLCRRLVVGHVGDVWWRWRACAGGSGLCMH